MYLRKNSNFRSVFLKKINGLAKKKFFVKIVFALFFIGALFGDAFFVSEKNKIQAASQSVINATIKISVCGNNIKEGGEDCDGSDLNGQSCSSRGFSGGGTLSCLPACSFNTSSCISASSGGGGGGGGGSGAGSFFAPPPSVAQTSVTFSGKAYPKSVVTLLKDAQVAVTTVAGSDANFQMSLSGLSAGSYIFSLYAEDKEGRRSNLLTFPAGITSGAATNISGIFIAPTITTDKSEVKKGDNIAILGQSVPLADVIISINSDEEFFGKVLTDKDGAYLYNFDTSVLESGLHTTKSKASLASQMISSFSHAIGFKVGTKNVEKIEEKAEAEKGDVNDDKRVNIVDFSIMAYWYSRPSPPISIDLNNDGKINIVDFSILAYHWTG